MVVSFIENQNVSKETTPTKMDNIDNGDNIDSGITLITVTNTLNRAIKNEKKRVVLRSSRIGKVSTESYQPRPPLL
jgi:hypothetical protein